MGKQIIYAIVFVASMAMMATAQISPVKVERLPVVADINGLAVSLVKPAFPETAVVTGADGSTVVLRVVVDENGNVVSATCSTTCHPMLKEAAELAAMTSKFKPQMKDGKPVKYEGSLLYSFVRSRVNWHGFGAAIESVRQFDNITAGPSSQMLSDEFSKEKVRLLAIDANGGADYDTRQKILSEVIGSIKSKLKGLDLWRFELAMALRRVTFWTLAGVLTDRAEMQKAIDALPGYIAAAPAGVSEQMIKELTAFSKYRVTPEIAERDLRKAINDLARRIPYDSK